MVSYALTTSSVARTPLLLEMNFTVLELLRCRPSHDFRAIAPNIAFYLVSLGKTIYDLYD